MTAPGTTNGHYHHHSTNNGNASHHDGHPLNTMRDGEEKEEKWGSNDETMFRRLSPRLVLFFLLILFLLTNIYLHID